MSQQAPHASTETQYNRACDACRQHKVRCLPDTSSTSKICQRCTRTDRRCVFTALQKRKQRKRTDTRVAELEREVHAMRALLDGRRSKEGERAPTLRPLNEETTSQETSPEEQESKNMTSGSGSSPSEPWTGLTGFKPTDEWGPDTSPSLTVPLGKDVIERGVITEEHATQLFKTYVDDLAPSSPFVVFPPGSTANEIRRIKPTLFLAVISAAAGKSDPSLFSILSSEVLSAYTHRTVINSEKSVELVQSMLITSVWYYPPGKFAQLKFYEYIHAAASMAMDIGLGTKPTINRRGRGPPENFIHDWAAGADHSQYGLILENHAAPKPAQGKEPELDDLEKKRTFLACYMVTTGVAMSMRRPSMLRFNSWVAECANILSSSPLAFSTDAMFCHWIKLMIIAEDIYTSFSFDDEVNCANLSETRVQFMLKSFEKRLESWRREITPKIDSDVLQLAYHHLNIYMHEIAIHDEHPPEDFRPPFRIDKPLPTESDISPTSIHIDSLSTIISSAQAMLDKLLAMSIDTLRSIPIYNYVRMAYACIILMKLYISTRSPSSQIGPVLDRENLKIGFYLKALIARLTEAVGPMECRSPYTFLGLLMRLQEWFIAQESQKESPAAVDLFTEKTDMAPTTENGASTKTIGGAQSLPGQELSRLLSSTVSADQIYPLDASGQQMEDLGLQYSFDEQSTAYVPHIDGQFQFSPSMGMGTNFMDPFQLFDGLDAMGGDMNEWTNTANLRISAESIPGQNDPHNWNFDG